MDKMKDIMTAPVIIPTLNRYEHLSRCIESLEKNSMARQTEIYVSVDYPPNSKYEDGYHKVVSYLKNKDWSSFQNANIYYQSYNLGAKANSRFLVEKIYKKYDRYIYTEDDNEFAPDFLEYINKGLDLFEQDSDIVAICGYKANKEWDFQDGNVIKTLQYAAWGVGRWMDKENAMREWVCRENLEILMKNGKVCRYLYKNYYKAYRVLIEALLADPRDKTNVYIRNDGSLAAIDCLRGLYMIMNSKYTVMPDVSKVRNWGYDGSGLHCGNHQRLKEAREKEELDTEPHFDYHIPTKWDINERNKKLCGEESFKKKAKVARRYRYIAVIFGLPVARKVYNAMYLLSRIGVKRHGQ